MRHWLNRDSFHAAFPDPEGIAIEDVCARSACPHYGHTPDACMVYCKLDGAPDSDLVVDSDSDVF